ncbi:unnamed protein product [Zymoseptoria tritici ST99CH_1A5]|uniref:DUF2406 domain-containing protein n=4 Tax=Zymoseptoria tritici TaxID=1047171 RepID=F9XAF8_ZYMTI|nr:uncharacterized protein MYCGRDRAFT_109542 [Zymoseptoria tritici IPO323]SMQ50936.1 unnamed protein product [Zymoseptoria tritici ST99CH_3D7]SMR52856.1 unnamed protein product [Zymoseptoria tritici ST99CH_1E4]SMR54241.1 unnamed protein product [Zymoseptoria tritici ST99CH_3D1]SMY24599.1 unnamed protein product [Zymoseptoria tritici ST99CH_1A5]EGP87560.1 hypothetical protein MYCGRDRAFT_109542 [Zymoseptoria tritici IPO323]
MDHQPSTPTHARPGARSRGSRTFSYRSDKSNGSRKEDLTESPKDKQRRDSIWKSTSKANPNAAITEAQPGVNAVLEESTLTSLRGVQHKDVDGNPITDPDLSNPTRPRLERPLDTIRSFEKAIDQGYKRRSSYVRAESDSNVHQDGHNRRISGYGYDAGPQQPRQMNGGYYGEQRPGQYGNGPARRYPTSRMSSEPMTYGQRPYGQHAYQHSADTMATGGSDSTGQWANSTDPSSENSSIDRAAAAARPYNENGYPQPGYPQNNGYGPNGFQGSIPEDGAYPMRGGPAPNQAPQRRPIALGNSGDAPPPSSLPSSKRPAEPEKKKGWLSRRFSKRG